VFSSPTVKTAIRLAVGAINRPRWRKSANAITGDILTKLLATCYREDLTDIRDRAIPMVAFASGGRHCTEIACLRMGSGYFTEAANRGIPMPEAMEQSRHRSVQQASDYYNNAKRRSRRASRLP